ncbi:YdcF family protein [Mycobacterium sp.]|uniref:YdcF family protein n=1 Tax=Mycobacterium sp. TaxID=1785 RepID=UPI003D6C4198
MFGLVILALNGVVGYIIFGNAADSGVSRVDAVVVLGGEHDGRESYGLTLARQGLASTVVLSDPYPSADPLMRQICSRHHDAVEVICARPDPVTTRGEAMMTRRLAKERNWKKILVVSWRYHLPRARLVFSQCLSTMGVSIAAKAVPRHYTLPLWYWQYIYLYQFAGIAKAVSVDHC